MNTNRKCEKFNTVRKFFTITRKMLNCLQECYLAVVSLSLLTTKM